MFFSFLPLAKPHSRAAAVFVNEFDADVRGTARFKARRLNRQFLIFASVKMQWNDW